LAKQKLAKKLLLPVLSMKVLNMFRLLTVWVCNFLVKGNWSKAALKMLMKLSSG